MLETLEISQSSHTVSSHMQSFIFKKNWKYLYFPQKPTYKIHYELLFSIPASRTAKLNINHAQMDRVKMGANN